MSKQISPPPVSPKDFLPGASTRAMRELSDGLNRMAAEYRLAAVAQQEEARRMVDDLRREMADYRKEMASVWTRRETATLYSVDYPTFTALSGAAGTNTRTLVVLAGTHDVAGDLEVPIGVTLRMTRGAILKPASGKTITIKGEVDAGFYQIFDTSAGGSIVFGAYFYGGTRGITVKPEWWGAVGDNTTDCSGAIQAALNSIAVGVANPRGVVEFGGGWFKIFSTITLTDAKSVTIKGQGAVATAIVFGAQNITAFRFLGISDNITIRDMWIGSLLDNAQYGTTGIQFLGDSTSYQASEIVLENLRIDSTQSGINLKFCSGVTIRNVFVVVSVGSYISEWADGKDYKNGNETAWVVSTAYTTASFVSVLGSGYRCILNHTSDADKKPTTGTYWRTYWEPSDLVKVDLGTAGVIPGTSGCRYLLAHCYTDHNSAAANDKPLTGSNWTNYWQLYTGVGIQMSYCISSRLEKVSVVSGYDSGYSSSCIVLEGGCDTISMSHIEAGEAKDYGVACYTTAPSAWAASTPYTRGTMVELGGNYYSCYTAYTSALGADLVTNGAFASDTAWTKGTGWTIATNVASSSGAQSADSDLTQTFSLTPASVYQVVYTVSGYSAGNVCVVVGDTEGTDRAANGTYTEYIMAGAGADFDIRADLNFVGSIDNVSVKLVLPAANWHLVMVAPVSGPRLVKMSEVYTERCRASGFLIASGRDVSLLGCHAVQNDAGVAITGGDSIRVHASLLTYNNKYGIGISGGTDTLVEGCTVGSNSQLTANTYPGIVVLDNVTHCRIIGNRSGTIPLFSGPGQSYGLSVYATGTDYITVKANDFSVNTSGNTYFLSTGSNNSTDLPGAEVWTAFTDGDTTPSVADSHYFYCNNSSPTTITQFDDGEYLQLIYVRLDVNTTIQHDASPGADDIVNSNGRDMTGDFYKVVCYIHGGSGEWVQVSGTDVYGARVIDARCDDVINTSTWDATTADVLDALRDAMITHGLIAAS